MILTQHYLACLSHASYLIGDDRTRRAVVVDPRRDVGVYLEEAAARGLRIERVIETHIHADFLSGHLELADRTGAIISYGEAAEVDFPFEPLRDGQRLSLGEVVLEILSTPGHTPESICILVWQHADDPAPYGVLTGDTLFVGDVGRPDLQASAAADLSAEDLARRLYRSLRNKLLVLPDSTRVYPAHGAGSACGKALSSDTTSTIGEQRRANYALQEMTEDAFVVAVTEGQPARPRYFAFDAQANRHTHPLFDETPPPRLALEDVLARRAAGAVLLDPREPADFAVAHLTGAINVGLQGRFAEWAGDVLPAGADIVLVGDPALAGEAKVRLARVGLDRVAGQLDDPAVVFIGRPDLVEASSRLTIGQLAELRGLEPDLQLVDVRGTAETAAGTVPGAIEIPLAILGDSLDALDRHRPVVVYCASGYRSLVAASFLAQAGFADVSDLAGGFGAWQNAGLTVAQPGESTEWRRTPQVSARAARSLIEAGAALLDVREPDEWAEGHAAQALLVPMGEVQARRHELPTDRRIVVVCRSGGRSAAITDTLRARGYDAVNLTGGMCAWTVAGLPVIRPQAASTANATQARRERVTEGMLVHREEPLNFETSIPALIGGVVTPNAHFYVRNHFATPAVDAEAWRLEIGGLVERPLSLGMRDIARLPSETRVVTLECAGNARHTLDPPVEGEPWRYGAVSTAEWTGTPLTEILDRAGVLPTATELVFRGADQGPVEGRSGLIHFERSLSIDTARSAQAIVAYAMNGEALPLQHGYPLRLVVPGWYGVASVKWLTHIEAVGQPFDAYFQTEKYWFETDRVREPVTLQRVRALVTSPVEGEQIDGGETVIRGVAWSGAAPIARVEISLDNGPWQPARLLGEPQRHRWQWWELLTRFDQPGPVSIRARATDLAGRTQPDQPVWNRQGYGNNAIQQLNVTIRE
jgi:DMSO/TMAO reductase YedYZ molybdopterin-dependent catalytic subunit/rhodanese-related sulfurtransferase/glyoxylase-like metal-dependent hydrolase (beta-lactamase superfamily II)